MRTPGSIIAFVVAAVVAFLKDILIFFVASSLSAEFECVYILWVRICKQPASSYSFPPLAEVSDQAVVAKAWLTSLDL